MNSWAPFKRYAIGAYFFIWIAACPSLFAAEPIPQKFLGDVTHPPSFAPRFEPIQYRGVTIRYDESSREKSRSESSPIESATESLELNLIVSGNDKRGRPWTVYIEPPRGIAPGYAWAADLDADGGEELIFFMYQGGNGWCINASKITVLSFDGEDRPVPWLVEGFFDLDYDWQTDEGKGVQDFGDWNENGRAELVQFDCDFDSSQEIARWFFIADVYELNQTFWRRLSPAVRAQNESQYRAHGFRMKDVLSPKDPGTFISDYSNDPAAGVTARILSRVDAVGEERCGVLEGLELVDGQLVEMGERERQQLHTRCHDHFVIDDGVECYGKPAIVRYSPKGTIAVMDGYSDRATELLDQAIREKQTVKLTGQLEEGRCSPAVIWITIP